MASKYYNWEHGRVHYQKRGMGDPLLLVHNVYPGASYEEYEHNLAELARYFTVYAIDLLGFGKSDAPRMKYTSDLYMKLIRDFLRSEVGRPAQVVAAGLSCAYVAEAAARHGELFEKLVFICPRSEPIGLETPRWFAPIRRLFLASSPTGSGFYDTMTGEYGIKEFLRNSFYNPKAVTKEKVERLQEQAKKKGTIYPYASLLTGYLDSRILEYLPRVFMPVLLIWGRQARPAPVEHSVRLVAITPKCHLEVIGDAGAWVHDEQSAAANRVMVKFLGE